jgi:hypothetical protein
MTTDYKHPITPPEDLVRAWASLVEPHGIADVFAAAARWGADQELEACCEWFQDFYRLTTWGKRDLETLRDARRPKPPSLKEQARSELIDAYNAGQIDDSTYDTIRRALEQLDG